MWADGICINQEDIEEKTQQVKQMGQTYALARHTIIFLGSVTPEAVNAFAALSSEYTLRRLDDRA